MTDRAKPHVGGIRAWLHMALDRSHTRTALIKWAERVCACHQAGTQHGFVCSRIDLVLSEKSKRRVLAAQYFALVALAWPPRHTSRLQVTADRLSSADRTPVAI